MDLEHHEAVAQVLINFGIQLESGHHSNLDNIGLKIATISWDNESVSFLIKNSNSDSNQQINLDKIFIDVKVDSVNPLDKIKNKIIGFSNQNKVLEILENYQKTLLVCPYTNYFVKPQSEYGRSLNKINDLVSMYPFTKSKIEELIESFKISKKMDSNSLSKLMILSIEECLSKPEILSENRHKNLEFLNLIVNDISFLNEFKNHPSLFKAFCYGGNTPFEVISEYMGLSKFKEVLNYLSNVVNKDKLYQRPITYAISLNFDTKRVSIEEPDHLCKFCSNYTLYEKQQRSVDEMNDIKESAEDLLKKLDKEEIEYKVNSFIDDSFNLYFKINSLILSYSKIDYNENSLKPLKLGSAKEILVKLDEVIEEIESYVSRHDGIENYTSELYSIMEKFYEYNEKCDSLSWDVRHIDGEPCEACPHCSYGYVPSDDESEEDKKCPECDGKYYGCGGNKVIESNQYDAKFDDSIFYNRVDDFLVNSETKQYNYQKIVDISNLDKLHEAFSEIINDKQKFKQGVFLFFKENII